MNTALRQRRTRLLVTVIVCVGLLAVGLLWHRASEHPSKASADVPSAAPERSPAVVLSTSHDWKTIRYRAVRVDIPASWQRVDMRGCEFAFEHWAPAGAAQCDTDRGVAFYTSATFDPGQKPGVHSAGDNAWAGYTDAGDLAVYAAGNNRAAVQRALSSARADDPSAR